MSNHSTPTYSENQWLHQLYMQAPVAIGMYIGKEHIIEFANPMMCEIWGRSEEQVINKPLFKAVPEVAEQGFEEILEEVLQTGVPFVGNELPATLIRNGEIEICYFNILYKPLLNTQNEITGIIQLATEVTPLVAAKKEAEWKEEVLKIALEGAKMGTWYRDLLQQKSLHSQEYASILGYDQVQTNWSFDKFLLHVVAEDRPIVEELFQKSLQSGHLEYEVRIQRTDKSIRWIQVKGKTTFNLKGQPICVSGIVMDVTEQKEIIKKERQLAVERVARESAEKQKEMLYDLFNKAPALICTFHGPDLVFGLVNAHYQQLFPGRQLTGIPMLQAVPELKGQQLIDIIKNVYDTGETFVGNEVPVQIDRNGKGVLETGFFNITYQALRDSSGAVEGILLFAFELTEQIMSKRQAENSEEQLRMALDAGKMGTFHLDLINNTSTRSLQHDLLFGYNHSLSNWSYDDFMQHVLPEDKNFVASQFEIAYKFGDLFFEARIVGADERLRWISIKGKTFYEQEKPARVSGVVMDITERKVVEEKLKELTEDLAASNAELKKANAEVQSHMQELSQAIQQLKLTNADLDNFIYTASHDLKTPISNIEGLLKLLLKNMSAELLGNEQVSKTIRLMEASIERFKTTIVELTDIAKVQKEAENVTLLSIPDVIEEVLLDLEIPIQEAGVLVQKKIIGNPTITFSHRNLKSIIYNLLSNAIKYRHPERTPKIVISCYREEGHPVLSVKDNGLGIKEKDFKKIFTMYTRLHTHVEGTGIGLYLVKRIVDNAVGKLEVESKEGEGSVFTVIFPANLQ